MNELQSLERKHLRWGALPVIVGAVAIGAAVSYESVLVLLLCGMLLFGGALLLKPEMVPLVLLLLSAISLDVVINFTVAGFDAVTFYKIGILLTVALSIRLYGYTLVNIEPLLVLGGAMVISYTLSDFHPNLSSISPLVVLLGVGAPFLLLAVKWDAKIANRFLLLIPLLSLVSISAGFLLELLGMHAIFHQEYLGANRLQGANMGAHLAMLAFMGFAVSLIEMKRRPETRIFFLMLAGINFTVMFATGTRGALISCLFLIVLFVLDYLKDYLKGRILAIVPLVLLLSVGTAVMVSQWENILERTFNEHASSELGVNLSGREVAWGFFLTEAEGSEVFGQGLGASLVVNDGSLFSGFTVPHNEYIRFYFDTGVVGALLFFLALTLVFARIGRSMPDALRYYHFALIAGVFVYSFVDNTLSTIHFIVPFCLYLSAMASIYRQQNVRSDGRGGFYKIEKNIQNIQEKN